MTVAPPPKHLRMDHVPETSFNGDSAEDLLTALVAQADSLGRYHGDPMLMATLFWEQDIPRERIRGWLDELVERGDVVVRHDGPLSFAGYPRAVAYIRNRARFDRFRYRQWVPTNVRRRVMERDAHRCQECWTTEDLSLDHIIPYSRGGPDTAENLRVLCRSCNSRKGARV